MRPIKLVMCGFGYRKLAAYGHMGREDLGVKWENTDRVDALKAAVAAL